MRWPSPYSRYNAVATRNVDNHILRLDAEFNRVTSTRANAHIVERATRPNVIDISYTFYIGNTASLLQPLEEANVTQYTLDYIFEIFRTGKIQTATSSAKTFELANILYDPIENVVGIPLEATGSGDTVDQTGVGIPLTADGIETIDSIFI